MIQFVLKRMALVAVVLSLSVTAFAGKDRGGGNVFEAEFKQIGYQTYDDIKAKGLRAEQIGFELIRLEVALHEVQILGTDKPVAIEDQPRMAINSPMQKLIIFSNSSWMILNPQQKQLLVLHEYLRFVGVDDSEYTFSLRIAQLLKLPSGSTPISPAPSARARVFDVVGYQVKFSGRYFDVIEERSGAKYVFGIRCEDYQKGTWMLAVYPEADAKKIGLPRKLGRMFNRESDCAALYDLLSDSHKEQPVKLIVDPVRALTDPNEYLTIQY